MSLDPEVARIQQELKWKVTGIRAEIDGLVCPRLTEEEYKRFLDLLHDLIQAYKEVM